MHCTQNTYLTTYHNNCDNNNGIPKRRTINKTWTTSIALTIDFGFDWDHSYSAITDKGNGGITEQVMVIKLKE